MEKIDNNADFVDCVMFPGILADTWTYLLLGT